MKNIFLTILFSIINISVSISQEVNEPLRIPLSQSRGASVDELFSSVNYIPLESSKSAMIQEVEDFWATENEIIIFDRIGNAILFFESNGKFKHKIDKVPNCAPCNRAETLFSEVFVNKQKKEIYAIYGTTMENVSMGIFDFGGKLLDSKKEWVTVNGMGFLNNSLLLEYFFYDEKKLDAVQFIHNNEKKTLSFLNPKIKDNPMYPNRISKNEYEGKLYWSDPYQYRIHSIDSNANISSLELIFPIQYSLPKYFLDNNTEPYKIATEKYPNAIMVINNIIKVKDIMILNLMIPEPVNRLSSILLNMGTGSVYNLNQIKHSSLNSYLPISSSISQSVFLDNNKSQLYSLIYPQDVISHFEDTDNKAKIDQAPAFAKDIVKNRDVVKNPIVVVSNLK